MTLIQNTYCSLLRQAIGLSAPSLNAKRPTLNAADIDALVHLAQIQGTAPLIYNELLKSDEGNNIAALKQICMQNAMGYEQLLTLLKKTWHGLVQSGVRPVVLKGFGLAALYPIPYLRSWGDLDIYVGPEQYHQAAEVLRLVFPHAEHHEEEWEELKHYNFVMPEGLVEMHRTAVKLDNPVDNRYFWRLEHEAMKSENVQWAEIEDVRFAIPEAKFNLLFTFFHAWFHFIEEEVGLKQICDVALLAHYTYNQQVSVHSHQSIASYLRRHLRRLHLWEPWQLIGYVCVTALGLPKSEWPLYEEGGAKLQAQRERFLQHVITNGLMRRNQPVESISHSEAREKVKQMNYFARKWKTLMFRLSDAHVIAPYSPAYARHMVVGTFLKGITRTITGAKMIDY